MDHGACFCHFYVLVEWHWKFLGGDANCPLETRPYFDIYAVFCRIARYNLRSCPVSDQCALHETGRSEMGGPYRNRDARSGRADIGLHDLECCRSFWNNWDIVRDWEQFMLCKLIRSLMSSPGDCSSPRSKAKFHKTVCSNRKHLMKLCASFLRSCLPSEPKIGTRQDQVLVEQHELIYSGRWSPPFYQASISPTGSAELMV